MVEFREGGVVIAIPNATLTFPANFNEQIAHVIFISFFTFFFILCCSFLKSHKKKKQDYLSKTGDNLVRFACVTINVVRTDAILATDISINSAVVGVTFIVYVNNTAIVCCFFFDFLFSLFYIEK